MNEKIPVVPGLRLFRPRKQNETAEQMLVRVAHRLQAIQIELDNWITMPTRYGILVSHKLEDEKQLMLKVKALLLEEIKNDGINLRHELPER